MNTHSDKLTLGNLLGDVRILVVTFIALRMILFIAYQPFFIDGVERGIGVGGDRIYYYLLASFADDELYPFRDWWSEFPPIWHLTTTTVYVLLGEGATYDNWSIVLGAILLTSELGVLLIFRKLGAYLHGANTGMALAWVYSVLALPIIFLWWSFDSLVVLFALIGLWLLIQRADVRSAVIITLGALTKFVPLLIFGVLIRFMHPKRAGRYIVMVLGLFILAYIPLFSINAELSLISLTAQFDKPSYQTVWALLDGNYTTGSFGSVESHLTAEGIHDDPYDRNPALIPSWLRLLVAGGVGLFVFLRTRRFDALGMTAFFGITLLIFYLQSQGFSPQWLTIIIPLLLLVYPNRNGVYVALVLSLLAFIEYPLLFIRTGATGGVITPDSALFLPWVMVVLLRTGLMLMIAVAFYQKLRQYPNPDLAYERE